MYPARSLLSPLLAVAAVLTAAADAPAQVLHHWRFEPGAFLEDSVGGAVLVPSGAAGDGSTFGQVSIPDQGRGDHFPVAFGQAGANSSAVEFRQPFGTSPGGLDAANTTTVTADFTIEVFANLQNISASSIGANLSAQAAGPSDVARFSWVLLARGSPSPTTGAPRELALITSDGSQFYGINSGIVVEENVDYYLAGVFDLDGHQATFYAHNLEDNSLHIATVPHRAPSLNPHATLSISGSASTAAQGLVDEVRLTNGILGLDELLIADAQFSQPGLGTPSEVRLAPRAIYSTASGNGPVLDMRTVAALVAADAATAETRLVAKFDLPELPDAVQRLESARLRLYYGTDASVSDLQLWRLQLGPDLFNGTVPSAGPADLALWHSAEDNDVEQLASDYDDPSYTDTGLNVVTAADTPGSYYEVDVTDLVLANYQSDGADPIAAFRLQLADTLAGDSALLRLAMPRDVANQPQLVLTFVPEPAAGLLACILVAACVVGFTCRKQFNGG